MPKNILWQAAAVSLAVLLSACGGDDDSAAAPAARGAIVTAQLAANVPRAQIDAGTQRSGLQPLSGPARCDVDVRYVLYVTRGPKDEEVTASAGVLVPTGTAPGCSGQRPVLLYAHGTSEDKAKNMADVQNDGEAALMMAMYAAQGYIVVAPNYLGYDRSTLPYHPYLNAEAQAVDMIDGLRAAKAHLVAAGSTTTASSGLLISGYSQGGHVAMATQKVIERDHASEFTVTANGPMSGPYNLVGFSDVVISPQGQVNAGATRFVPLLITSYQQTYGNLYTSPSEVYQPPYDTTVPNLLPSLTPLAQLMAENKLPNDPTFTRLFGPGGLLTDAMRASYFPASPFRVALQRNTLLDWTPRSPMALCGGAQDPTVFWAINTPVAQASLASGGGAVWAYNLEDRTTLPPGAGGDAVYGGFQQAKTNAGEQVQARYHGTLVPPFCTALIRGFFQAVAP